MSAGDSPRSPTPSTPSSRRLCVWLSHSGTERSYVAELGRWRPGYPAGRPLFAARPRPAQLIHPPEPETPFSRARRPPSFLKCPDVCGYAPGELSLTSNAGMTGGRDE
jgi:hypothetical protein